MRVGYPGLGGEDGQLLDLYCHGEGEGEGEGEWFDRGVKEESKPTLLRLRAHQG